MTQYKTQPKIYVAGHRGMVGAAIVRQLLEAGQLPDHIVTRSHTDLDLTDQSAVSEFFSAEKPDQVYLAAAKVGGIHANNTYPAEFIYDNLMIQANIIDAAFQNQQVGWIIKDDDVASFYRMLMQKFSSFINIEAMQRLRDEFSDMQWCVCPQCKYSGPSQYDNACPQCGYVSDDF